MPHSMMEAGPLAQGTLGGGLDHHPGKKDQGHYGHGLGGYTPAGHYGEYPDYLSRPNKQSVPRYDAQYAMEELFHSR